MTGGAHEGRSAVRCVTATLREEILAIGESGVFLGSEDETLTRLGTSRPTLRQAARILEHENLLEVRRGALGGFFTKMPSSDAVSAVAAVYLRSRRTRLEDLNDAVALIVPEIARRAAANPTAQARSALAEFADTPGHRDLAGTSAFLREVVQGFGRRLVALIDNVPLALFYEMLLDLAASPFPERVLEDPSRATRALRFQHDLSAAVAAGDPLRAGAAAQDYYAVVRTWYPRQPFDRP